MKAIASDLDGTLMFNRKVSEASRNCISVFQREGYFGLCTGRPLSGLEDIKDIFEYPQSTGDCLRKIRC